MKEIQPNGIGVDELKRVLFRFAHFDPNCKDGYGNQAIDYIVLEALSTYGQLKVTSTNLRECIKSCFRLEFEEDEIDACAQRLAKQGIILYEERGKFERPLLQILPKTEEEISKRLADIQKLDIDVIEEWKGELCKKYKDYPPITEKIDSIVANLQLFFVKMIIRHGVESVALIYPDDPKSQKWLSEVERGIFEVLPKIDPFLDEVAKIEIPKFFRDSNSKRRIYFNGIFNSSFFWYLLQIDDKCSKLIQEVLKGQILILDNNILYSLVGLHGSSIFRSVHSMLILAKSLGYELMVTTKTVDEFHNSLNWHFKELKQKPPIPAELLLIALDNLGVNSFLTCYWNEFIKRGSSIDEFVAEKSHIESILEGLKIKITNQFRAEIETSQAYIDEQSILRNIVGNLVNENIIAHDAFHRVLITKLRKTHKHQFHEATAWFLTHDTKLPEYDRIARKGEAYLPFCLTTNQWIQINRPLLARTASEEDYEESFYVIVTQPFLRTMISDRLIEKAYANVLTRMARFKNLSPQLASSIAMDVHFMLSVATETDIKMIDEKIENKFIDLTENLGREKQTLELIIKSKEEISIAHQYENERYKEEAKAKLDLAGNKLNDANKALVEEKKKVNRLEEDYKSFQEKFRAFKLKTKRWIIFAIIIILTSTLLWLNSVFINWSWLENHAHKLQVQILFQLLFVFMSINIPLYKHWKLWIPLVIAIMLGILSR